MADNPMGSNPQSAQQPAPQHEAPNQNGAPIPDGATKVCKACGSVVPKYVDRCPHCGKNLKPVYKKAWFWILIVFLVLCVGGVAGTQGSSQSNSSDSSTTSSETTNEPYSISGEKLSSEGYGFYKIKGELVNNSGHDVDYIQIEYVLKDADGNQVGTALANTNNLKDGETWKFSATGSADSDSSVDSFERADVTGF